MPNNSANRCEIFHSVFYLLMAVLTLLVLIFYDYVVKVGDLYNLQLIMVITMQIKLHPENNYYINFDFKRYYILDNKYKINYYIAIYRNNKRINLDYTDLKLLNEINGINWFSLEEIQKECSYLYKHIKPAFTFVKNNDLLL